jgi:primosomal protein N' (replication factor Y)
LTVLRNRSCLRVAVSLPVTGTYSYAVPELLAGQVAAGMRVRIPFGERTTTGYVLGKAPPLETRQPLKEIADILDPFPLFHENMIPFFEWISRYYLYPIGLVIKNALPGGINTDTYRSAVITRAGVRRLEKEGLPFGEKECLLWVKAHPGARLPRPLHTLYRLREKGLLELVDRVSKNPPRPRVRRFVKARNGIQLERILKGRGSARSGARDEVVFLERVFSCGGILQSEICREFGNGRYLVDKWVRTGVLECVDAAVYRNPAGELIAPPVFPKVLLEQQTSAIEFLNSRLRRERFSACLLHGITGSGKTEVYLRAIEEVIRRGRQAILMVPEISLASYMYGLFRSRLGDRISVYHSGLSRGERYDQWIRALKGEVDLVVGPRSAIWAPLPDPGLIIVDEEHDTAYKQENPPRYQARDAAAVRARMEKAVVVLGSGTPSIQSYHHSQCGRYHLLRMPERVEKRRLPEIEMVDMRSETEGSGKGQIIGRRLREAIRKELGNGNQALLFLNRRGFHRLYVCLTCGKTIQCPNCDVALIHHQDNYLRCHYCGFHSTLYTRCPSCGGRRLKPYGFGTERLEAELHRLFSGVRVARMDTDSTKRKGSAFQILKKFGAGEIDVLVGTQMITKGYDFPNVTLVGVLAADLSLGFPDFRAGERTFHILSQVAGRAGRGTKKGRVIVQTFNVDHYAIKTAVSHDYESFFAREMELREALGYPPFSHMTCLKIKGNSKEKTAEAARFLGEALRGIVAGWPKRGKEIKILGPAEAPLSRVKGKYRWQVLVKGEQAAVIRHLVLAVESLFKGRLQSRGVQLSVDVDSYQMS